MELAAAWRSSRGPQGPPAPPPLILPELFSLAGSAKPCQPSAMEQPLLAPPAMGTLMAPGAPRGPPPGLWMAPCGCFFDPRVFHFEWATTTVPPPANSMGSPSLPNAAPGAPQSWVTPPAPPQPFVPYKQQGAVVTPLLPSVPNFQQLEGQIQQLRISEAPPSGSTGAPSHGIVPADSDTPMGASAIPNPQEMGANLESLDIELPDEVLLEEAVRLFNCSPDMEEVNQDNPSSIPVLKDLGDLADLDDIISCHDMSSLSLPEEMLSSDYSIPEASSMMLSVEQLDSVRMNTQEMHQDLTPPALLLSPPQGNALQPKAKLEKRGKKRRNNFLLRKGCK
ncbi:proline-rich protein 22 [Phasianus colchicus]|uniref:proline-rich protein 22 n=1 Tax=Phasianus colchicus TaxID=9054 RepID=UPI00129E04C8|nr:proline-rich protein 22 [Phasianus colchicus]